MKKIVTVIKQGTTLPIDLDVSRIVAISNKRITESDKDNTTVSYYIFFENAIWAVKADSYELVYKTWSEYVQH